MHLQRLNILSTGRQGTCCLNLFLFILSPLFASTKKSSLSLSLPLPLATSISHQATAFLVVAKVKTKLPVPLVGQLIVRTTIVFGLTCVGEF